ncbi:helix-turn-helix transcriptional regulator [Actinomycetes bacterium KLBMP 9759]
MTQDWPAVAAALKARLDERGMTMTDLATRSGVSLTTVRELVHVLNTRKRQPRTLASLSSTLGWPEDHLGAILRGQASDPIGVDDVKSIRAELADLRGRVEALERSAGDRQ